MLLENVTIGRIIEIYVDRDGYRYRLTSKIENADSKKVCVTLIASHGKIFKFRPDDRIRLIYRDAEQLWEWDDVKAGLAKSDGVLVHYFEISDKGRSYNRRNAYRVSLGDEILIGYYDVPGSDAKSSDVPTAIIYDDKNDKTESDEEKNDEKKSTILNSDIITEFVKPIIVEGIVKDVSATGVGICTNTIFKPDDSVFFDIPSPYGRLKVKAQVIRHTALKAITNRYRNYYGCVMTETDKKLIKYIYEIQRKQIKKQKEQQYEEKLRRERIRKMYEKQENIESNS